MYTRENFMTLIENHNDYATTLLKTQADYVLRLFTSPDHILELARKASFYYEDTKFQHDALSIFLSQFSYYLKTIYESSPQKAQDLYNLYKADPEFASSLTLHQPSLLQPQDIVDLALLNSECTAKLVREMDSTLSIQNFNAPGKMNDLMPKLIQLASKRQAPNLAPAIISIIHPSRLPQKDFDYLLSLMQNNPCVLKEDLIHLINIRTNLSSTYSTSIFNRASDMPPTANQMKTLTQTFQDTLGNVYDKIASDVTEQVNAALRLTSS
jgi:hypothetical protein